MSATTTVATAIEKISQIFMIKAPRQKTNGPPGEWGGLKKPRTVLTGPRRLSIVPQSRDRLQAVYARTRLRGNFVNKLEIESARDAQRTEAARLAENGALESRKRPDRDIQVEFRARTGKPRN